jgi:transposase
MVTQQMYQEIQRLKRKGAGISAAAEELKLDRKTASKYYHMSEAEFTQYRREAAYRQKKFDTHAEEILAVYEENGFQKLNVASVYDYLEEFFGKLEYSEKTLRNYVLYLQEVGTLKLNDRVRMYQKVPELPFGQQMQMDFGQYTCASGLKLYIFSSVLSASRYKFMVFQDRPFLTVDVIEHMLACFDYFGGIVTEVVIDQDSLLVASENHGDILYTKTFGRYIEEMDFSMYVCRKADPESKGKVENTIKYVKQNFLSIRDFENLEEANQRLMKWLTRRANGKLSQATKRIPAELMDYERERLKPLRNSIFRKDAMIAREPRSVNDKSYISVSGSLYSVPTRYRKKSVEIYLTAQKLFVFDSINGEEVCEHLVAALPGTMVTDRGHFRAKEHTTEQIRQETEDMFTLELWHDFLAVNTIQFSRYVRDQCLDARRYFSGEIDLEILHESLKFCLDINTVSFANLRDTYTYLNSVENISEPQEILNRTPELPLVAVRHRAIEDYRQVVASLSKGA